MTAVPLPHMFREKPIDNPRWLTLCSRPVGDADFSVELAWDAPRLLPTRICADCVRRFHRIRRPPILTPLPALP